MIIEYWLESKSLHGHVYGCQCCGKFESWEAFDKFVALQIYHGKTVSQVNVLS